MSGPEGTVVDDKEAAWGSTALLVLALSPLKSSSADEDEGVQACWAVMLSVLLAPG